MDGSQKFINVAKNLTKFLRTEAEPDSRPGLVRSLWNCSNGIRVIVEEPAERPLKSMTVVLWLRDYEAFLADIPNLNFFRSILRIVELNAAGRKIDFRCNDAPLRFCFSAAKPALDTILKAANYAKAVNN